MSTSPIPTLNLTITGASPSAAARAYGRVDSGADDPGSAPSFGGALERAMQGVIDDGNQADAQSMQAVAGQGNLTEVVTAVSRAELALQTTVAIRDRVVQAYQDIMRMSI